MPRRPTGAILGSLFVLGVLSLLSCKDPGPADIKIPPFPYSQPYAWDTSSAQAQSLDADSITLALQEIGALPYVESFLLIRNGFLIAEEYYTTGGNISSQTSLLSQKA